ncbi:SecDF P1 head subdomain-containing protein [Sphingobium sp. CAP-1]|uniref:SecDF P1 head subdomain-containing protein n=1 Tax=Sphingobium sp. CAP-1 TaxID=2676077 RepID=UPI0012BB1F1D|nr:hypothetical protein [Sphingobium sp. CAP-1]QGP79307.1 hypothetical protein GL174_10155 [Sphingobium sp. CAP-1]
MSGMSPPDLMRPTDLSAGGIEARKLLDLTSTCLERHPPWRLGEEYQRREDRYREAIDRDEGLWGSNATSDDFSDALSSIQCRKSNVAAFLAQVDKALDAQDTAFANATKRLKSGFWVGSIKLCKDNILEVNAGFDEFIRQPRLSIKLTLPAAYSLASLTRRSINKHLAVRLDGVIIARPNVNEPIEEGVLQISGPDEATLKRASVTIQENVC